jgi:hypothetical protein
VILFGLHPKNLFLLAELGNIGNNSRSISSGGGGGGGGGGSRGGMKCWASILTLTFGTTMTTELSALRAGRTHFC